MQALARDDLLPGRAAVSSAGAGRTRGGLRAAHPLAVTARRGEPVRALAVTVVFVEVALLSANIDYLLVAVALYAFSLPPFHIPSIASPHHLLIFSAAHI